MYITYNAWYKEVAGTTNDRQALDVLKKRYIIWDDYRSGKTMRSLRIYMEKLSEYSQREPFSPKTLYWSGSIEHVNDWRSLIELWYQVRCRLVHGSAVPPKYVWLAYETLDIFMGEITLRMSNYFKKGDSENRHELHLLSTQETPRPERFRILQDKLYQKYIASSDLWQVDMQRVTE